MLGLQEQTLMAIAAGKHVLCEKPIATSLADAEEMYAAAEATSLNVRNQGLVMLWCGPSLVT